MTSELAELARRAGAARLVLLLDQVAEEAMQQDGDETAANRVARSLQ